MDFLAYFFMISNNLVPSWAQAPNLERHMPINKSAKFGERPDVRWGRVPDVRWGGLG